MPILPDSTKNIVLPKMFPVIQWFSDDKIDNIAEATRLEVQKEKISNSITPNASVAVLVGSRGITGLKDVVKATIEHLIELGAKPFIVPDQI